MVATEKLTWEDYQQFPDDGNRYEIIDGEVYVSPSPGDAHQFVATDLTTLLNVHVRERKLGRLVAAPFDVMLGPHDVFQPDILFIRAERRTVVIRDGRMYDAPDLCVEIASPSTRQTDRTRKFDRYAHFGVAEYWLVEPIEQTVETFVLEGGAYVSLGTAVGNEQIVSPVMPDLALTAAEVFEDL